MFIIPCFTKVVQNAGQVPVWVGLGLFSPSKLIMKHKMACLIKNNIFREVFFEYRVGVFFPPWFLKEIAKKLWD